MAKKIEQNAFLKLPNAEQVKVNNYVVLHNLAFREFEMMENETKQYVMSQVINPKPVSTE